MQKWQRTVRLDGCVNFRDLGGYATREGKRVRTGQVFRSAALHLLSASDIARLRDELRIGSVIDLRSTAELRADGRGLLEREPIRFQHLPLYDGNGTDTSERPAIPDLAALYVLMAEGAMRQIGNVLSAVAWSTEPTVYHCAAGKDRTGVVSALILGLLEVEEEFIVADYALTQEHLDQIIPRLLADAGYRAMLQELSPDTMHAQPQTMRGFLQALQGKYGSIHGYAETAGVSAETIRQLRERLIED
jgi:protein-tyrosine phosphatase